MDFPLTLYDALVSINVPNDKARAVVEALEQEMVNAIATKQDLQLLGQKLNARIDTMGNKIELLSATLTERVGSMLMIGLGLLFAALKLT